LKQELYYLGGVLECLSYTSDERENKAVVLVTQFGVRSQEMKPTKERGRGDNVVT